MAQLFSGIFFTLAAIGALAAIAAMLRGEWNRITAILAGEELTRAQALAARPVRIRQRNWRTPRLRRAQPLRAAA